jgi:hypothetical protein
MSITIKTGRFKIDNTASKKTCLYLIMRDQVNILNFPHNFELIINDIDLSEYVIQLLQIHKKKIINQDSLIASLSLLFHS